MRPILFSIELWKGFCLSMSSYRFFATVGLIVWLYMSVYSARARGYPTEKVLMCSLLAPLSAWFGSIVASHLIFMWHDPFKTFDLSWKVVNSKSSVGGFAGAFLSILICCKLARLPALKIADLWTPYVSLAFAFGRIGCLLAGCCYGIATNFPLGLFFPDMTPEGGTFRHPTQIYLALAHVLVFLALKAFQDHPRRGRPGQITALFFAFIGTVYFLIQPLRCFHPMHPPSLSIPAQMIIQATLALAGWGMAFGLRARSGPMRTL